MTKRPHPARRARRLTGAASILVFLGIGGSLAATRVDHVAVAAPSRSSSDDAASISNDTSSNGTYAATSGSSSSSASASRSTSTSTHTSSHAS